MKGIILAAGRGTRMYPMTIPVCKPLVPVYDKPLVYYPLAVLLQAGITDILVITSPFDDGAFQKLLGDGSNFGAHISYAIQHIPRGIADAFIVGKDFIGNDSVCLVLGDNIFYGDTLTSDLKKAVELVEDSWASAGNSGPSGSSEPSSGASADLANSADSVAGAVIFGHYVEDPRPFGVVEFDETGKVLSIEEKPAEPKSNYIVPGLYFYPPSVVAIAENVKPSARGEMEITSVNNAYLEMDGLTVIPLGKDFTWLDAGNADSLLISANTIHDIQKKTGKMVACLEEIAYKNGNLDRKTLETRAKEMEKTDYGAYLKQLL